MVRVDEGADQEPPYHDLNDQQEEYYPIVLIYDSIDPVSSRILEPGLIS